MQAQRMRRARLPPDWGPKSWSIRGKDLRRRKTLPPGRQATIGFSALIRTWKDATPRAEGYRFARQARYLGRWIRHSGWYPDWKLRLFHRKHGQWVGSYVHESVKVEGRVETLPGKILHYTCDSLEEHRQRIEFYTDLAAVELADRSGCPSRLRRSSAPLWAFMQSYFF